MSEGGKSEVAQLLQQIEAEYAAAKRGLHGLAEGAARHDFITKRMENLGSCHEKLATLIGKDKAIELLAETIWSPTDREA